MAKKTEKKIKDSLVKGAFLALEELMTWVSKHGVDKDSKRKELVEELGRMVQEFEPGDKVEDDVIETLKGLGISLPDFMNATIEKDEKEPVVEEDDKDEDEEDEDDEEEKKDEKPKKKKKPIEKEDEDDEDEDEEDEEGLEDDDDDDEHPPQEEPVKEKKGEKKVKKEKKTATKKTEKKASGPGVISSIAEFITKSACTEDQLVEKLAKRFPDKDSERMRKTIKVQLPKRMNKERGMKIERNKKGAWTVK